MTGVQTCALPILAGLGDAEETLKKLQKRQDELDLTADALESFADESNPAKLVEKLANAGCGAAIRTTGTDVLDRLKTKMSTTNGSAVA
mgnify:CR=1 FL=1